MSNGKSLIKVCPHDSWSGYKEHSDSPASSHCSDILFKAFKLSVG